jgi:hypothetical protein
MYLNQDKKWETLVTVLLLFSQTFIVTLVFNFLCVGNMIIERSF